MAHDRFIQIVEENRVVADQLLEDLERQFHLLRQIWQTMDRRTFVEELEEACIKIEHIEVLIGIKKTEGTDAQSQ